MRSMTVALVADEVGEAGAAMPGSLWMTGSMVVLALFLVGLGWALMRPRRPRSKSPAEDATERFARGEIDADEFERTVNDLRRDRR